MIKELGWSFKEINILTVLRFWYNFDGEVENVRIVSLWAERRQFMKDSAAAEKGAGKARKSHHGTEPPIAKKRTLAANKAKI